MTQTQQPTNEQVADIASATKRICNKDGFGNCVAVFQDFSWLECASSNENTARGAVNGGWNYRLTLLRHPMTQSEVRTVIAEATEDAPAV